MCLRKLSLVTTIIEVVQHSKVEHFTQFRLGEGPRCPSAHVTITDCMNVKIRNDLMMVVWRSASALAKLTYVGPG